MEKCRIYTVLCTILLWILLHTALLNSTILHESILYYTILYYTILYYTVRCCTIQCCTASYCDVLHHVMCTELFYITQNQNKLYTTINCTEKDKNVPNKDCFRAKLEGKLTSLETCNAADCRSASTPFAATFTGEVKDEEMRKGEGERERKREREKERETESETERQTERQTDRGRERER